MKRREFALGMAAGTGSLLTLALAGCKDVTQPVAPGNNAAAPAPASQPAAPVSIESLVAGQDYVVIKTPVPNDAPKGKAEVIEFFGYWCPHCYRFEPEFEAWAQSAPAAIVVQRVPLAFRPEMAPLQRMYYALQDTGTLDAMHAKVFDALHKDKQQLFTDEAVLAWAAKQPGLAGDKFAQAYKSFSMAARLSRANQLMLDYSVESVPSLGVAGKYYIDAEHAKGMPRALQIATALALKEAGG